VRLLGTVEALVGGPPTGWPRPCGPSRIRPGSGPRYAPWSPSAPDAAGGRSAHHPSARLPAPTRTRSARPRPVRPARRLRTTDESPTAVDRNARLRLRPLGAARFRTTANYRPRPALEIASPAAVPRPRSNRSGAASRLRSTQGQTVTVHHPHSNSSASRRAKPALNAFDLAFEGRLSAGGS
jgi:hypothetical protein